MAPTQDSMVLKSLTSPLMISASIFLIIAYVVRQILLHRPKKLDLPVVGDRSNTTDALAIGSKKYPDTPFVIPTQTPTVILPLSALDEVRNLPENKVSFAQEIAQSFSGKYTGIGNDSPAIIKTVKVDLTRHYASTLGALQDEMRYATDKELGACEDWKKVVLYQKVLRIVALLSSRVFIGLPLSRDEEWVKSSIEFTIDCISAKDSVQKYPWWSRPFIARWIPEIRRLNEHKKIGARILRPMVEKVIERTKTGKIDDDFDDEMGSFITWLLKYTDEKKRSDPQVLAENQLNLSFAAIHTTTMATCHIIYDLASHPEYIPPLRAEIEQVMEEDGYEVEDGRVGVKNLKKTSLPKLKLLDSFLKESQRLSPPSLVSNTRLTTADLHLSTGHTIPKGTRIAFNSDLVNQRGPTAASTLTASTTHLPALDDPSTFSPFRFSSLRTIPGHETKHQFVTTSHDSLNFGHGNHACPGRFFAGAEIKVVALELIRNWEFRLVEKDGKVERPQNYRTEFSVTPNPVAEVEFRRRGDGDGFVERN